MDPGDFSGQSAPGPQPAALSEPQPGLDDPAQERETLESQLKYSQDKLDAAEKRLKEEAGTPQQEDQSAQEVKDWDARVRDLQQQIAQLGDQSRQAPQDAPPEAPQEDIILPGDNLEIFVVEDSSFNGHYQVRRGGYIILPPVGRIPVAGKTMEVAAAEVSKALETSQLQHATVTVDKVEGPDVESGPVIFLAGEFRNRTPFRIPPGTKPTVVNVILSCGGVTDNADLTRVKVMRVVGNKSVVEEENVRRILEGSGLTSDLTLSDGDVIVVPAGAANAVFVTGRVNRPGTQYLHPGDRLTAYAAILNAGGFSRFADKKKVYVLRASPDGTKVRIPINIFAIEHGHQPDLPLAGNDILIIPEKWFSW